MRSNSKKKPNKLKAYRFGLIAESLVQAKLMLTGWRPIARRWKSGMGEVDLIMARGRMLVFLEVKARQKNEPFALHPTQVERLQNAAQLFLAKHPRFASFDARIDVVFVAPWRWPVHLVQAI